MNIIEGQRPYEDCLPKKAAEMSDARTAALTNLTRAIDRIENTKRIATNRTALGNTDVDQILQGGLARGSLHEVFSEGRFSATATCFIAGLAHRVADRRAILWIRQDFAAQEAGDLAMTGFSELGFDPTRIVMVRAKNAEMVLRIAADGLACRGIGAVVAELWGETKAFDLVASRKLTLVSGTSGTCCLMLRLAATPCTSTAETRWIVRPAHSPPSVEWEPWGEPVFDVELVRNRNGSTGHWMMKWKCDEFLFSELPHPQQATHSQPATASPANRSGQTFAHLRRRFG